MLKIIEPSKGVYLNSNYLDASFYSVDYARLLKKLGNFRSPSGNIMSSFNKVEFLIKKLKRHQGSHSGPLILEVVIQCFKLVRDEDPGVSRQEVLKELLERINKIIETNPQYEDAAFYRGAPFVIRADIHFAMGNFKLALDDVATAVSMGPEAKEYISYMISRRLDVILTKNIVDEKKVFFTEFNAGFDDKLHIPKIVTKPFFKDCLTSFLQKYYIPITRREMTPEEIIESFKGILPARKGRGSEEGDIEAAIIETGLQLAIELNPQNMDAYHLIKRFFPKEDLRAFPKA